MLRLDQHQLGMPIAANIVGQDQVIVAARRRGSHAKAAIGGERELLGLKDQVVLSGDGHLPDLRDIRHIGEQRGVGSLSCLDRPVGLAYIQVAFNRVGHSYSHAMPGPTSVDVVIPPAAATG